MNIHDILSRTGKWLWANFPYLALVWLLLAVPCCLKTDADGGFHFAKVKFITGVIGSFSLASALTLISQRSKIAKAAILLACWLMTVAEIWLFACFKTRMSAKVIMLIAQTDATEAKEFITFNLFSPRFFIVSAAAAALSTAAYFGLRLLRPALKRPLGSPVGAIAFWMLNIASIALTTIGLTSRLWFEQISYPSLQQLAYSISFYMHTRGDIKELEQTTLQASATYSPDDAPEMIVWIIGESFNKHHSPLYGYPLNTQPNLSKESRNGNLIVFANAVTASASTAEVMAQIFSTHTPLDGKPWEKSALGPTIFHKAGYHVALHDNQTTAIGGDPKWDTSNMWFLNSRTIAGETFDYRNDTLSAFDLDFVNHELADSSFSHCKAPSLQIFHLMGQHFPARNRYRLKHNPFSAKDYDWRSDLAPEQKAIVAEYDNATAYNDLVIAAIIKQLEDKDAVIIYHSDHGEEVYDFRNQYGRTMEPVSEGIYRNIYEVPLIIYTTPLFRELHPETFKRISDISHKNVSIADISHFLIEIGGISSPHFVPSRSFIHPAYTPSRTAYDVVHR